jgi:hypothetical protein
VADKQWAVLEFSSPDPFAETTEDDRIPLFSIDGQTYTIPARFDPIIALRALDMARRRGEEIMFSWLLEEALGEEGYQALLGCSSVTPSQLQALMEKVSDQVMGALEEPGGN